MEERATQADPGVHGGLLFREDDRGTFYFVINFREPSGLRFFPPFTSLLFYSSVLFLCLTRPFVSLSSGGTSLVCFLFTSVSVRPLSPCSSFVYPFCFLPAFFRSLFMAFSVGPVFTFVERRAARWRGSVDTGSPRIAR